MKKNIILILTLISISLITGLLHIIGYYYQGQKYTQLALNPSFTTYEKVVPYMARTRQILNKGFIPKWDQLYEYQNAPSPYISEIIPGALMAIISHLSGSVEKGFIVADFTLPPLIFLLVFSFLKIITKKFPISVVGALGTVLVRDLFLYFPYPWAVFKHLFGPENRVNDLIITRSYHPEASIFIYLLTLIFIYLALRSKELNKRRIFLAGVFFGLSFYNYLFHWTTLCLFLFFLFLLSFKKNYAKRIILITLIGFAIAIPFFLSMINFNASAFAKDFAERSMGLRTVFPYHRALRFIVLPFILALLIKKKDLNFYFFNTLIFAAAILPDLSYLILGKDLEGYHWVYISLLPVASIYYFSLIDEYLMSKLKTKIRNILYFLIALSFIAYGFRIQYDSGMKYARFQRWTKEEEGLFKTLASLPKYSVVASFPKYELYAEKNQIMLAATDNYVFVPYATLTVASSKEIVDRVLITLLLFKSKEQILKENLYEIFVASQTYLNLSYFERNKDKIRNDFGKRIDQVKNVCHKYKIDYFILEKDQKLKKNCFQTKRIYKNEEYEIYKVIK